MSGPATATSYEESVASCGPPTPATPPAPAAPRGTPVRRQLDFTGGGDLEDGEDEEFLCRVADDIERGYSEAKRRAPPCVCGRGVCAVERHEQSGRWKYVCPSRPKCNHVAFCEEVDLNPKSLPTARNHPEPSPCAFNNPSNPCAFNNPSNPCAFNNPSNHMAGPRAPVNVGPQVTGAITPVNVRLQIAGTTTLFGDSPQGAGVATLVNISPHGDGVATPANDSPQGVGTITPAKFIPQGVVATTPPKIDPQDARSNCKEPVCRCTAGKCRKTRIGKEDWYVCPIPKGKGACSYKVLISDFVKENPSAQATPGDEVHRESPSMLHRSTATVNTPSKSPMRPMATPCQEIGHSIRDCPKQSPKDDTCSKCRMPGHWIRNCPQL